MIRLVKNIPDGETTAPVGAGMGEEGEGRSSHQSRGGDYNWSSCDIPPSYLSKPGGGGGGLGGLFGGGGLAGGCRGGVFGRGGGSQGRGACARPTTTTCIPPRGMCVWGFGDTEVCMQ